MAEKSDKKKKVRAKRSFFSKLITLILFIIVFGGIALAVYFRFLSVYIGPGEFGVKQVMIGFGVFKEGIGEKVYGSGYTLEIPYIQKVHVFPRRLQILDFSNQPGKTNVAKHYQPAAYIQTSDGYFVRVDLSIIYNITNPYKVLTRLGPGTRYITEGIVPKAEPIMKQSFGELTSEDFYNSPLRVKQAKAAKKALNNVLKDKGLKIEAVLIRYFHYSEQIQKNIEEKKLKDQLVFKNQAEARAAKAEATLKKVVQEGKAAVKVRLEKGKAYAVQRRAEKDKYTREKKAKANLLVKLANAKRIQLKNEALSGNGALRMVGLEMSDVLHGIDVIVIPSDGKNGYNPLDLEQTMRLFNIKQ